MSHASDLGPAEPRRLSARLFRKPRSAATRIALASAAVMMGSLIVFGGLAVAMTYAALAHDLDRRIGEAGRDLLRTHAAGGRDAILAAIREHDIGTTTDVSFALFSPAGEQLAGPRGMDMPPLGWSDVEVHDPIEGTDPAHTLTLRTPDGGRLMTLGSRRALMTAQAAIGWLFLTSIVLVALLCSLMGWRLARYLRLRLYAVAETAGAVREGDLDHRVPLTGRGDEFDDAAASLNLMLDRIAGLMANLRQVSSDLAHDLRTPLTRIRIKLERLREGAADPAAVTPIIAQVDDMVELFDAILRIAQIDGAPRTPAWVDLQALALDVVGVMAPIFTDAGMRLRLASDETAVVAGDAAQIGAALVNLLENVLRHAGRGSEASVLVRHRPGVVALTVRDTGWGVPAADRERIFDRFVRLDPSRSAPGHGLGLSLVRSVAVAHDARITVDGEGGGLAITLAFPAPRDG